MKKERIFLSGTDEESEEITQICRYFEELGHEPIWYKEKFLVKKENAMDTCLRNIETCDRFILILKRRYGCLYKETKKDNMNEIEFQEACKSENINPDRSITETEFEKACNSKNITHILIFIKDQTWFISKPAIVKIKNGEELKKEDGYKAEKETYEFIERLYHRYNPEGKPDVKWANPYDTALGKDKMYIIYQIKQKWPLPYIKIEKFISWDDKNFLDPLNKKKNKATFMREGGVKQIDIENDLVIVHPILEDFIETFSKKEIRDKQDKIYMLVGKMACGKSTLIRLFASKMKENFYYFKFNFGFGQSEQDLKILYNEIFRLSLNSISLFPPIFVIDDIHLFEIYEKKEKKKKKYT